jgi:hypothetical protein
MRRKKSVLLAKPGEFKGTVSRNNRMGFKSSIFILGKLTEKISFCVLGECALLRKRMKNGSISADFGPKSKNYKSVAETTFEWRLGSFEIVQNM